MKASKVIETIFWITGGLGLFALVIIFSNEMEVDLALGISVAFFSLFCFAIAVVISLLRTIAENTSKEAEEEYEEEAE